MNIGDTPLTGLEKKIIIFRNLLAKSHMLIFRTLYATGAKEIYYKIDKTTFFFDIVYIHEDRG